MPAKKRGPPSDHPNAQVGRKKIRTGDGGKKLVEQTIRNNVLLLLQKLTNEEATNYGGPSFNAKLSSAVSGALDPQVGPEALIDLSSYDGFDDPTIFANRDAGQLMATLLTLVDGGGGGGGGKALAAMQQRLDNKDKELQTKQEKKEMAEDTLARFQSLMPLDENGQKEFLNQLTGLASDIDNAGWLYGILWTSCLQWMDTRLRQMRAYGLATTRYFTRRAPTAPPTLEERTQMINTRVHGGDLRVDAVMCAINFGNVRHNDANYDVFFRDSFKRMYNLRLEDGLWLAKNGLTANRNVDWPRIIGIIDKFVSLSNRVADWSRSPKSKAVPNNFKLAHSDSFANFTAYVSHLIMLAEADVNWIAKADPELNTLAARYKALLADIGLWKENSKSPPEWTVMAGVSTPWPPANYLRDLNTPANRIVGRGDEDAGLMSLRPQARVDYST